MLHLGLTISGMIGCKFQLPPQIALWKKETAYKGNGDHADACNRWSPARVLQI